MRSWALRIFVLLWVAAWFGVVLPGHDRGAVTLPGSAAAGGHDCPLCVGGAADGSQSGSDAPAPGPAPQGTCCAICQFTATLCVPPAFAFDPPDSYLIDLLAAPAAERSAVARQVASIHARGPPLG